MRQLKIEKSITNRSAISFNKYLFDVSQIEMITPQEEFDLAARIREGDTKALDKLVKSNLRFVISVEKQYQNFGVNIQDLVNEGNIGLIKAAQKFDETRGFKFISYAVWWIRQMIQKAINDQGKAYLQKSFDDLGLNYLPTMGNFIAVNLRRDGQAVYDALLQKGVIVRPVGNYNMPEFLRITIGTEEQNSRFIKTLTEILA